jgi:hypothetical protein
MPRTDWGQVLVAGALAVVPAVGVAVLVAFAAYDPRWLLLFLLALPAFGYLLARRPTAKAMLGGTCFWLAVETLPLPVVVVLMAYSALRVEDPATGGAAGTMVMSGTFLLIGAVVVGIPVALVPSLLSRWLDGVDPTADSPVGGEPDESR